MDLDEHADPRQLWRGEGAATAWVPFLTRYARRHLGFLAGLVIVGAALGIGYRYLFDPLEQRVPSFFLRSSLHGIGLAIVGWSVHLSLVAPPKRLRDRLRQLPQISELAIKALIMTAVLTIVTIGLQLLLYSEPFSRSWLTDSLPLIVAIAFCVSLVAGGIFEFQRLIGGRVLGSFLLGTYRRPRREQRIVMFLDMAGSTALAEEIGEVRMHDLITRFFFDIDQPIADFGGEVHAYVGDEVIVTWPLSDEPRRNVRPLRCFFAAEDLIADLARSYLQEFGVVPRFRAGVHAGPVVISECGDVKRQIAFFGDTMNVASRLCDHTKVAGEVLVASAELLKSAPLPPGLSLGTPERITLRGRRAPIEVRTVRRDQPAVSNLLLSGSDHRTRDEATSDQSRR